METLTGMFENIARHLWAVSWQVAVLAAVIAAVECAARKASPLFRYGLWMIVLIRLAVPVAFTVPESAERMVRGKVDRAFGRRLGSREATLLQLAQRHHRVRRHVVRVVRQGLLEFLFRQFRPALMQEQVGTGLERAHLIFRYSRMSS